MPTIHGPVLTSLLDKHHHRIDNIKDILDGKIQAVALIPQNQAASNHSPITSELTGGNLTVLCCSIGTALDPNTEGKILVIEDIGERGYRLRRSFTHLEQSGKISKIAACIFGDFTDCDDKVDWALKDFMARNPSIPIFRLKDVGHGDENIPLVFGAKATIIDSILEYSF
jgi:muramoyltetrapeptide carboxypeptidase